MRTIPMAVAAGRIRAEANPIQTALELLKLAAERSKKPEADLLKIINEAIDKVNDPATDPQPKPATPQETPDARANAIRQLVAQSGAPAYLADFYIKKQMSVAAVKAELLPYVTKTL